MKKRIIAFLVAALAICATCTSCFTTMAALSSSESGNNISKERTYLNLTIIQTISKNEALAWTKNYDVVKIETVTDTYYDGKKISGYFTLVGTYSYVTNQHISKTVPVYVLTSEYSKNKDLWP